MLDLLRRCGRFVGAFWAFAGRRGVIAAALVAAGAAIEGAGVVLLVPLLALATRTGVAGTGLGAWAGRALDLLPGASRFDRLALLLALFALLLGGRLIVAGARDRSLARLQLGFVDHLSLKIARALGASNWPTVARLRHARVGHIFSSDIERCGGAAQFVLQLAMGGVMLLGAAVVALALSPPLAAVSLAIMALGALALGPALTRARDHGAAAARASLALADMTHRFLGGFKLALGQDLQHSFVAEFEAASSELRRRRLAWAGRQSDLRGQLALISAVVAGVVIAAGLGPLQVAPAVLITLLAVMSRMAGPAMQVQQAALQLVHALPAYEAVAAMAGELAREPAAAPPARAAAPPEGDLVMAGVAFRHLGGRGVRGIDLVLEPGVFLGVRGPSGSGKTTLADLLVGLLEPDAGSITVGGVALRGEALIGWRQTLAYVSQDPFLFHDTIARNLLWASPGRDEEELWRALELVGAGSLVRAMPGDLQAVVGERGVLVSGGERQRLALARALVRRPRLLVLDEATNALDPAAELGIVEGLTHLKPRPTVVMIAHRPASLAFCDDVIQLDNGALVSPGPGRPASRVAARG